MPTAPTTSILTGATNADLLQDIVLAKLFVSVLRKDFVLYDLGTFEQIAQRSGENIRWQFFDNPVITGGALTPLTRGVDPADSEALGTTPIVGQIEQYGSYFEHDDLLFETAHSGSKEEFVKAAGYKGRGVLDTLIQVELGTTSSVITTQTGAPLTVDAYREAASLLASANAQYHRNSPGGQYYVAVAAPKACYEMFGEGQPAWSEVKTQAMSDNMNSPLKGTPAASAMYDMIVKRSSNIQDDVTDFLNLLIADDSFGISSLEPKDSQPKVNVIPPSPSLASPLGMRGIISWKVSFLTKLFDDNRVAVVKSGV